MRDNTTSPSSTHTTTPPNIRQHHRLPLSCRECQRKKVKCDRSYPCGQCSRAGHSCTPSTRKPRAKVGSRAVDIELRNRIAKLEKLVETFQGDDPDDKTAGLTPNDLSLQDSAAGSPDSGPPLPPRSAGNNIVAFTGLHVPEEDDAPTSHPNKYSTDSFLSTLTTEVQALREAFEEGDLDEDYDALSSEPTPPQGQTMGDMFNPSGGAYELLLCPPGALFVMPGVLNEPEPGIFTELCNMYLTHMEPYQRIFHAPTLEAFLFRGEPYLGNDAEAPCNRAVRAAICFAGLAAMRDHETLSKFGKHRDKLIMDYRRMVDVAIYQIDPMNTTEIAALQALVVYSSAIRMTETNRRTWTLLGLIIRIARALNIHREAPDEPIYRRELCRRLWYTIVYLDCYATLDRGSEPAIDAGTFERPLPTNCNDSDFSQSTTQLQEREGEITDLSFSLVCFQGSTMVLQMSSAALRPQDPDKPAWQYRIEQANTFSRSIDAQVLRFCDPSIAQHRLLIAVGKSAAHSMILRAVRPLDPQIATCSPTSPPNVSTFWVLQLAVIILKHGMDMDNDVESDLWRRMPWVPWHAIAVALAGLCSIRNNPVADEAWDLIEGAMPRHVDDIADSRTGMLWKPIEKLRRKAALFRDQGLRGNQTQKYAQQQQMQQNQKGQQQPAQQQMSLRQQPQIKPEPIIPTINSIGLPSTAGAVQYPTNSWTLPQQPKQQLSPRSVSFARNPGMRIDMPGAPAFQSLDPGNGAPPILTPIATDMAESSFLDFPPDMLATVPDEGSWLDWENIMKDMDVVNAAAEQMQMD